MGLLDYVLTDQPGQAMNGRGALASLAGGGAPAAAAAPAEPSPFRQGLSRLGEALLVGSSANPAATIASLDQRRRSRAFDRWVEGRINEARQAGNSAEVERLQLARIGEFPTPQQQGMSQAAIESALLNDRLARDRQSELEDRREGRKASDPREQSNRLYGRLQLKIAREGLGALTPEERAFMRARRPVNPLQELLTDSIFGGGSDPFADAPESAPTRSPRARSESKEEPGWWEKLFGDGDDLEDDF